MPIKVGNVELYMGPQNTDGPDDLKSAIVDFIDGAKIRLEVAVQELEDEDIAKAIIVGLAGAVGVCGISDIAVPHVSLMILGVKTPWHVCFIEHPDLVLPFAGVGVLIGIASASGVSKSTLISHSLHVFASTMASIFYMVGPLGIVAWIDRIGVILLFTILAVVVPCCASDIVFPMLMSKAGRRKYELEPHVH